MPSHIFLLTPQYITQVLSTKMPYFSHRDAAFCFVLHPLTVQNHMFGRAHACILTPLRSEIFLSLGRACDLDQCSNSIFSLYFTRLCTVLKLAESDRLQLFEQNRGQFLAQSTHFSCSQHLLPLHTVTILFLSQNCFAPTLLAVQFLLKHRTKWNHTAHFLFSTSFSSASLATFLAEHTCTLGTACACTRPPRIHSLLDRVQSALVGRA